MVAHLNNSVVEGVFLKESKNRFLCEAEIDGRVMECYVPSSCHLGNFLDLHNKRVLLVENANANARTKYALYALPYKRSYILLNPSLANKIIVESITSRRFSFLGRRKEVFSEYGVNGYKCDVFIKDTDTIIEIKSVISTNKEAVFPTVYSQRGIRQLQELSQFLITGKKVFYFIVALNPYIDKITINGGTEFCDSLKACMELGLEVKAYAAKYTKNQLSVHKEVYLEIPET